MAIETTYFTPTTGGTNWTEFSDWMSTNATEYFSEFTLDTSVANKATYSCKKDDTCIKFIRSWYGSISANITIVLQNGVTKSEIGMSSLSGTSVSVSTLFISRAIKTNSGIIIAVSDIANSTVYYDILCISKTNTGNTGIIVIDSNSSDYSKVYSLSLVDSKDFTNYFTIKSSIYAGVSEITSFCQVPCIANSTEYFPNVFVTPFYKYNKGTIIDNDGIKYVFIGGKAANYLVLKD